MSIVFYIVTETLPLYVSKNAMSGNWDAGLDVVQLPLPRKPTEKHHLYIPSNHHVANVQSHNAIRQNSVKMWHHLAA